MNTGAFATDRTCQWEFAAALAAAHALGDANERLITLDTGALSIDDLRHAVRARLDRVLGRLPIVEPVVFGTDLRRGAERFVGRMSELWELHARRKAGPVCIVVDDSAVRIAGSGKSMLVEEYARQFAAWYPGGIYWLRAGGGGRPKQPPADRRAAEGGAALRDLALAADLPAFGVPASQARGLLGGRMERVGQPCLWVVDDLPSDVDEDELKAWHAPHRLAWTLLVGRSQRNAGDSNVFALGTMPPADATAMILRNGPNPTAPESVAIGPLLRALEYHASAIDVASALGTRTLSALISRVDAGRIGVDHVHALVFATAWRKLTANAMDVVRIAFVTASAPLPLTLIARVLDRTWTYRVLLLFPWCLAVTMILFAATGNVWVAAASVLTIAVFAALTRRLRRVGLAAPRSAARANQAIEELLALRLARACGEAGQFVVVPGLAAMVARRPRWLERIRAWTVLSVLKAVEANSPPPDRTTALVATHGRALARRIDAHTDAALLEGLAAYDLQRGDFESALHLQLDATLVRLRARVRDPVGVVICLNNLAIINKTLGNLDDARRASEKALEQARDSNIPLRVQAIVLDNLGDTLRHLGDADAARHAQEQALTAQLNGPGEADRETPVIYGNLALTLEAQGELQLAIEHMARAYQLSATSIGVDAEATRGFATDLDRLRKLGTRGPPPPTFVSQGIPSPLKPKVHAHAASARADGEATGKGRVFISYARGARREQAEKIAAALERSDVHTFLDQNSIESGEPFPDAIADALLEAQVVLVLPERTYFTRPWCLHEFQIAVGPLLSLKDDIPIDPPADLTAHIVVALGEDAEYVVAQLPAPLARTSWPSVPNVDAIVALTMSRLAVAERPVSALLGEQGREWVREMREAGAIPWPEATPIANDRHVPASLGRTFFGRATELWRLAQILGAGGIERCLLAGPGGIGKTQLAAEFARRYGRFLFPGGIVWIEAAADHAELAMQLRTALDMLVPAARGITLSGTEVGEKIAQHLASASAGPVLWIINNIEPEATKDLARYCPPFGHVALLCTAWTGAPEPFTETLMLKPLDVPKSVRLLTSGGVRRSWMSEAEWEDIARAMDGLPLALSLLRASLSSGLVSPSELRDRAAHLDQPAAYLLAFERLDLNARQGLLSLARLAPDPVPDEFARYLIGARHLSTIAVAGWIQDGGPSDGARSWRLHRVTARWILSHGDSANDPELPIRLMEFLSTLELSDGSTHALQNAVRPHGLLLLTRLLADASAGKDALVAGGRIGIRLALLAWHVFEADGSRFPGYAPYRDALALLERAITQDAEVVEVLREECRLMCNFVEVTTLTSKYVPAPGMENFQMPGQEILLDRGLEMLRVALDSSARVFGLADATTIRVAALVFMLHDRRGEMDVAGGIFDRYLTSLYLEPNIEHELIDVRRFVATAPAAILRLPDLYERVAGPLDIRTLDASSRVSEYKLSMLDYGGARACQERVVARAAAAFGIEEPVTLSYQNALCLIHCAAGNLDEAFDLQEKVLAAVRRHHAVGRYRNHFMHLLDEVAHSIEILRDASRHPEWGTVQRNDPPLVAAAARAMLRALVETCQVVLGDNAPLTLRFATRLSRADLALGARDASRAVQERTLQHLNDAFSTRPLSTDDDKALTEIMTDLADQVTAELRARLSSARDVAAARAIVRSQPDLDLLARVAALCQELMGDANAITARITWQQVQILELFEDSTAIIVQLEHLAWLSGTIATELPDDSREIRRQLESRNAFQEPLLRIHQRMFGPHHPVTLRTMSRFAGSQSTWAAAKAMQQEVIRICEMALGANNPETLDQMGRLIDGLAAHGEIDAASTLARKVYMAYWHTAGVNHVDTARSMSVLAQLLGTQGRHAEAAALWSDALRILDEQLGTRHPEVTVVAYRLLCLEDSNAEAEVALAKRYLAWLSDAPFEELAPVQQQIWKGITEVVTASSTQ